MCRCACGQTRAQHRNCLNEPLVMRPLPNLLNKWNIVDFTEPHPTDAYGMIEFQGGPHPTKAQVSRRESSRNTIRHVDVGKAASLVVLIHESDFLRDNRSDIIVKIITENLSDCS